MLIPVMQPLIRAPASPCFSGPTCRLHARQWRGTTEYMCTCVYSVEVYEYSVRCIQVHVYAKCYANIPCILRCRHKNNTVQYSTVQIYTYTHYTILYYTILYYTIHYTTCKTISMSLICWNISLSVSTVIRSSQKDRGRVSIGNLEI